MEFDIQKMIFEFLGGLGILLFGIKYMGDGLQTFAGNKIRDIIDKFTTNPFWGVLAGIIVTVLIHSSSGVTVIIIGLVSAGFMTLRQAIGVIMGANIGTTVTAIIIGIDVAEYALPFIFIGAIMLFFFKNIRIHSIGQIIFGFGGLFFGLDLMGSGMEPLRFLQEFYDLKLSMSDNPLLGVLVGTFFTLIVQSSGVSIGILQELYGQGLIELRAALPVLFGDNIGTTITAVLASIGASVAARRAALMHVLFNIIGTTIFMLFLPLFTSLIQYLQSTMELNPKMAIAVAHSSFNITNTFIQFPLIGMLAWIVTKLIPGEDAMLKYSVKHLDPIFIDQSSAIALGQAKEEVLRMGKFAISGLEEANLYQKTYSQKHADTAIQLENAINNLDRKITDYLILISRSGMSASESQEYSLLLDAVRDIERIGDHFENVVALVGYQLKSKVKLTDSAKQDLEDMFMLTIQTLKDVISALDDKDTALATKVLKSEKQIDKMERNLRKKHILRIHKGECSGSAGIVFVDILSNLERIGDHCVNISEAILGYRN